MPAKTLMRTQKIAEAIPGAWRPQWIKADPIAGPTTAPKLGDGERGDQYADNGRGRAKLGRVKGKQRDDHRQSEHVHESRDHEDRELPLHFTCALRELLQHLRR